MLYYIIGVDICQGVWYNKVENILSGVFSNMAYYDGTKLLSLKDLEGNTPEIFMVTTNRSGGKTTYFNRLCVNKWMNDHKDKFALLYRFNYELDDVADKFFKDIGSLFFHGWHMRSERKANGIFHELFLTQDEDDIGVSCGYAISLNSADQLKKYSHLFSDVSRMIFDEFQSETGHYCANEVKKFISIHTSIARGQGKQNRYVPVYMISNPVTLLNPYYSEMGISSRLNDETKFLKGNGFVLEQGFIESASKAQKDSGFNKAFANNDYIAYSAESVYLNDSKVFIEQLDGRSKYLATVRYNNKDFAVREFSEKGIIYCDDKPDITFPHRVSVTTDDHNVNYVMLKRYSIFVTQLRIFFDKGCFRFKNLQCKEAIMKMLSY